MYVINNYGYNDNFLNFIFENLILYNPILLLSLILKGYKPTLNNLHTLLKTSYRILILSQDFDIWRTLNLPMTTVDGTKMQILIMDMFDAYNITPTISTLNITCKHNHTETIQTLLNKYNIIPDKSTLDKAVGARNYNTVKSILNYKLVPDGETLKLLGLSAHYYKYEGSILQLLINYGLVIKHDDINYLLGCGYVMTELERFGIEYDKELYFLCFINNKFPDEYMKKFTIDETLLELHKLCQTCSSATIINFMEENKIKLDRYCMDYILRQGNSCLDSIILKYNCIPCEYSMYRYCRNSNLEKWARNKYGVDTNYMFETYDIDL
jgi:hypothetical protein